jgi:DNA replication initiation complex subunit (GINS family)
LADKEINITYQTLFELLRLEKSREELQKLEDSFFEDVVSYLKEKKDIIEGQQKKDSLFGFGDSHKIELELNNVRKILKELYERREKKIINTAMSTSRTSARLVDTSVMLPEEQELYEKLVEILNESRQKILFNVIDMKVPIRKQKEQQPAETEQQQAEEAKPSEDGSKIVRFLDHVSKFVGPNLEVYGPYDADEVTELPAEIAAVLINTKKAEEVNEND